LPIVAALLAVSPAFTEASQLPVFPGAEGFGVYTPAGRGGVIYRVTNLKAAGPGSLAWAISDRRPRTIIFDVGGIIDISELGPWGLIIKKPFVTIAGQTAPWPGITIKGGPLIIETHDVLIQHLRVRPGDEKGSGCARGPDNCDALAIVDLNDERDVYNVVIDHCSFSWAIDEVVSAWYPGVHDVTISNCIISEALNASLHPKGEHGFGVIMGKHVKNVALIRNLMAHNNQRNPLLCAGSEAIVLNNVVYNCRIATSQADGVKASIVGNVYLEGPDTRHLRPIYFSDKDGGAGTYVRDNLLLSRGEKNVDLINPPTLTRSQQPPVWTSPLTVIDSNAAESHVLDNCGATPFARDAVDRRVISSVRTRTGKIIDSQREVGGWGVAGPTQRVSTLPNHTNEDEDGDGYTNLEEWLHACAAGSCGHSSAGVGSN